MLELNPEQPGGLTLLGWVARVLTIARRATPKFRHSLNIVVRSLRLQFVDKSAVDVMPDRVILFATGDSFSSDARHFTSAYASDFEYHDVLEKILDPTLRLTPGMTLCGTAPPKGHCPTKKQRRFQLICLRFNLDPVSELVKLFHKTIDGALVEEPIRQIEGSFPLEANQPRVLVIGPRAQVLLQERDPMLTSILNGGATLYPDMICVLPGGTITTVGGLSLLTPTSAPQSGLLVPETMSGDETNNEGILTSKNTPSDDPEPGF